MPLHSQRPTSVYLIIMPQEITLITYMFVLCYFISILTNSPVFCTKKVPPSICGRNLPYKKPFYTNIVLIMISNMNHMLHNTQFFLKNFISNKYTHTFTLVHMKYLDKQRFVGCCRPSLL